MRHARWRHHQYTCTMTDTTVWILLVLLLGHAWATPVSLHERSHEGEPRLGVVSELSQRLASHSAAVATAVDPRSGLDPRLPLPSPQDLEAIRKVAQILIMLGEQVIPAIIGEGGGGGGGGGAPPGHSAHAAALACDPPPSPPSPTSTADVPGDRDPVSDN